MAEVSATVGVSDTVTRSVTYEMGPSPAPTTFQARAVRQWANGTSTSQINEVWSDERALSTGSETLDLTDLDQPDTDGDNERTGINFSAVKSITIINTGAAGGSGYLLVGGASTTPFEGVTTPFAVAGGKVPVYPGGTWKWENPGAGGSTSSANNLQVESVTADQTYQILVTGVKA